MGRYTPAILVLALSAAPAAEAQVVRGVVVEEQTRTPVAGAAVEILTARQRERVRSTTDSVGWFALSLPRAGTYGLRVRHPSYVAYDADSVAVHSQEIITLEIRLGRTAVSLEPLVVTARRSGRMAGFDARREAGGFGRFLTREQIDARGASRTTDLLRTLPGVTVTPVRARGRGIITGSMVTMSGGAGACLPAIWLDGVQVRQETGSTLDDFLMPSSIEALEVYTSAAGAPAQFTAGSCGAILFWTRRGSGTDGHPWQWRRALLGLGAAVVIIFLIR